MKASHLASSATGEQVAQALRRDGYVIVDNLVPDTVMDRISAEMQPFVDRSAHGEDDIAGRLTRRTGALVARSPTAREIIMHPTALGAAANLLSRATTFQLNETQIISVYPGSKAQPLHRDEVVWDTFPFPRDYDVQCNILWAMTEYTDEMGATRIVPGSQALDREDYSMEESIPAEMTRGSALFYTGKVYHGAGANRSNRLRQALNITYAVGWLRQEENQYLVTPLEVARTLSDDLLKVMGYQVACFPLGHVGNFEDPMSVIRPSPSGWRLNAAAVEKREAERRMTRSAAK
jgi:ectoine hydroxylase-related dioxygenase (phytanoyl-CoA dioxygenase family)